MRTTRTLFVAALAMSAGACTSSGDKTVETPAAVPAAPVLRPLPGTLAEAQASVFRKEENKARDVYRHPVETLEFFGLQKNMKVIEVLPGGGWYTEILAPYISGEGTYYAAIPPAGDNPYFQKMEVGLNSWIAANPEVKANVVRLGTEPLTAEPVDMVLTFRNVHNWMAAGQAEAMFKSFAASLKPGGVLGVEEHRADPKKKQDPKAKSGYVTEKEVIRLATKAGFKLDKKSEINANPKDKRNHPEGVWTLPPTLKLGDKDRQKYLDIGESDRMTLRFIKK